MIVGDWPAMNAFLNYAVLQKTFKLICLMLIARWAILCLLYSEFRFSAGLLHTCTHLNVQFSNSPLSWCKIIVYSAFCSQSMYIVNLYTNVVQAGGLIVTNMLWKWERKQWHCGMDGRMNGFVLLGYFEWEIAETVICCIAIFQKTFLAW